MPDVSVVVAAFDAMPYVTRALDSLFAQTIGMDRMEIITIDDGSTDGTGAELDRLAAGHPNMHVVHQENSGSPAHPRNVGLGMATGRYVFFLDADDYLGERALELMVGAADANKTDMVLGRIVGVGGRKAPRSIFKVNQPRTDVFHSRVYWSLNPMKLFRRSLIETLGLRFATDLPWGEDMPFTTECYLNASGISIVADYDCVYVTYRDDGNNFTKRIAHATSRLATPTQLLSMIERYVGPGRDRDYLMTRVFQLEVINILPRMANEPDPAEQQLAFDTIKGWVDRWYTKPIMYSLSPLHKIALNLVRRGMKDEVIALFPEWPPAAPWKLRIEGDRVFADYPYFRDERLAIPDSSYDVTRKLRPHCHIDAVERRGTRVAIRGYAFITLLDTVDQSTTLLARRRGGGVEYACPAEALPSSELGSEEWNRKVLREQAGFEAVLDPATLANGAPLPAGWWDLFVRISTEGVTRELWVGAVSCKTREQDVTFGNVFLRQADADPVAPGDDSALAVSAVRWAPEAPATLSITGRVAPAGDGSSPSVHLALLRREGGEHRYPAEVSDGAFAISLDLREADGGRPLEKGTWDVVLERRDGSLTTIHAVPMSRRVPPRFGRRGLWPARTSLSKVSPTLTISVERLDPRWLYKKLRSKLRVLAAVFGVRR